MSSAEPKKKAPTSSALLEKLKVEKKRADLLKTKQLKTLKLLEATKEKLEKYRRAYSRLKKSQTEAEEKTSSLQADLKRSQERVAKTLVRLNESRGELQSTKLQLRKARSVSKDTVEFQELGELESLHTAESAKLQNELEHSEQARRQTEEALKQVTKQLQSRETEHEEALLKLWDLEERIKSVGSDVSGALEAKEAEIEGLKSECQRLQEGLAEEESVKEKAQARLHESREEATRLGQEVHSLSVQLDEGRERIAVLMTAGQNIKAQLTELNQRFEELTLEHAAGQEAIARLKSSHQALQTQTPSASEQANLEPAEQRAAKAEARLKELEEQLMETRARLLSSHTQMEQTERAKQAAEERNEELTQELHFGASQLQQLESLISLLEQKEETHNRQLQAMRRQITELLEENNKLKDKVADKSGQLKNVERSFEETDESLSNLRRRYETTREALDTSKDQLTEARNRALSNLTKAEEAEKMLSRTQHEIKVINEENKVLKRRLERLQERVAELEMLS